MPNPENVQNRKKLWGGVEEIQKKKDEIEEIILALKEDFDDQEEDWMHNQQ